MSTSELVHDDTFCFNGTNYIMWRLRMLCHFRAMGPNALRIVVVGNSNLKDGQSLSLDDMHLDSEALSVIHQAITFEVFKSISSCSLAHEAWTKIEDIYGGSNLDEDNILFGELMEEFSTFLNHEELSIASTSDYLHTSTSFTSPTCGIPQGNDMVSEEISRDDGIKLIIDDLAYVDTSDVSSMDTSISNTENIIHSCVESPCISSNDALINSCDDMLGRLCCHIQNAVIPSSSLCETDHIEEIKKNEARLVDGEPFSPKESSSTPCVHMCLMARGNDEVSSSLSDNDDSCNEEDDEVLTQNLYEIGKTLRRAKNNTYKRFQDVLACFQKRNDLFLYEQAKSEQLEHELAMAHQCLSDLRSLKEEIEVTHCKLKEDFEHLDLDYKKVKGELTKLSMSHEKLQATHAESLASTCSSHIDNDACATNSILCEASILKENVELRTQLDLLTSNYGKLEESHKKLSGTHEDLLISHDGLKLAHEAMVTKVKSCESHVDISTSSTRNVLLPCASPCNSSLHDIDTSCDELLTMPCCSNNEVSTSSSSFVNTNLVEENKELKAQVTSLKKDLEKYCDNILSVQKDPQDKIGLDFISNKKKSKNKKKGQDQVKNLANIICFKCKNVGHHVRSCPLKKKASSVKHQGKWPQVQSQDNERPLPMLNQDNVLQVEKVKKKRKGSTCCYICREKGHISSSCPNGNVSKPPIVNDHYSLRKEYFGNLFAKFVGAQSGLKVYKTIWVAKPIVTNFLGPNLVGDHKAQT